MEKRKTHYLSIHASDTVFSGTPLEYHVNALSRAQMFELFTLLTETAITFVETLKKEGKS